MPAAARRGPTLDDLLAPWLDPERTTWEVPQEPGALQAVVRDNRFLDSAGNDVQRPLDPARLDACDAYLRTVGTIASDKRPVMIDVPGTGPVVIDMQHGLMARARIMDSRADADRRLASGFASVISVKWRKPTTPAGVLVRRPALGLWLPQHV